MYVEPDSNFYVRTHEMGCRGRPFFDLNELPTEEEDEKDSPIIYQPQKSLPSANLNSSNLFPSSEGCQRILNNHAFTHASTGSGFQPFVRKKDLQTSKEVTQSGSESIVNRALTSVAASLEDDTKASQLVTSGGQDDQMAEREEGEWSDLDGNSDEIISIPSNKQEIIDAEIAEKQIVNEESEPDCAKVDESSHINSSFVGTSDNEAGESLKDLKDNGSLGSESHKISDFDSRVEAPADGLGEASIAKPREVKGVEASHARRFANNPVKRPKLDEHKEAMLGKKRARQTVFINMEDAKQASSVKTTTPRRQTSLPPIVTRTVKDTSRANTSVVDRSAERQNQLISKEHKQSDVMDTEGNSPMELLDQKTEQNGDVNSGLARSKKMNHNDYSLDIYSPSVLRQGPWKQFAETRQFKNSPVSSRKPPMPGQGTTDQKMGTKKIPSSKRQTSTNPQYQDTSVERLLREVTNEKFWHHPGLAHVLLIVSAHLPFYFAFRCSSGVLSVNDM